MISSILMWFLSVKHFIKDWTSGHLAPFVEQQSAGVRRGISDSSVSVSQSGVATRSMHLYIWSAYNMLLLHDIQLNNHLLFFLGIFFDDWNHFELTVASQEYALHMNSTFLTICPEPKFRKKEKKNTFIFTFMSVYPRATERTYIDI